jgi:hypothetical protein
MRLHVAVFFYNHRPFVPEFFESLSELARHPEVEGRLRVSVYDDASTDGTADAIREHLPNFAPIITAQLGEKNRGAKFRLFHLLHNIDDDEVVFLIAGDDLLCARDMVTAWRHLEEHGLDALVCNAAVFGGASMSEAHPDRWPYSLIRHSPQAFARFLSTYYPRPLLVQATLFRGTALRLATEKEWKSRLDDWPIFIGLFGLSRAIAFRNDLRVSGYRLHAGSMSSSQERILSLVEEVADEYGFDALWGPLSIVACRRVVNALRGQAGPRLGALTLAQGVRALVGFAMEIHYRWRSQLTR